MEFKNVLPYDIRIKGSSNKGFIVEIGCSTSVFTDKKEMLNAIEEYINDPEAMEKAYNDAYCDTVRCVDETQPDANPIGHDIMPESGPNRER